MQTHELDAWLGETRADLTDDQYERLSGEAEAIAERYPDDDDRATAALAAAVQYLLGETDADAAGRDLLRARLAESEASAAAQQVARMAVQDGATEAGAARATNLDRMTVRKALGK